MFPPFPVGFPADDFIPPIHYIPNSNDNCYVVFGKKAVTFEINQYTGNSLSTKVETTGIYANSRGTATTETKWIRKNNSGNIIEIPVDFTRTYELTFSSGGSYPQYGVSTEWGFQGHSVIVYGKPANIYRYITEYASSFSVTSSSIYQTTFSALGSDCLNPTSPSPPSSNPATSPLFLGIASPPPPPPKNMDCCDCNTIATIIADQMADQFRLFESIKDHIDSRTKEEIQIFREQLEALEIDLQPILDRLNEVERNLWNGIPK